MHDRDREKATSLALNLVMPNSKVIQRNPYFNKTPIKEFTINLNASELYDLG